MMPTPVAIALLVMLGVTIVGAVVVIVIELVSSILRAWKQR